MYRTFAVRVHALDRLTPHFVRVTFASPDLADLGEGGPDQRIKLVFPTPATGFADFPDGEDWYQQWRAQPEASRNPIRTYTLRRGDPSRCTLVVDFVAHGDSGPATRWVNRVRLGDELRIIAPMAGTERGGYEWHPGAARTVLLAGDETAVPAISGIIESLRDDVEGAAFLEVPSPDDVLPLTVPAGLQVQWLPREGAGYGERLAQAVPAWLSGRLRRDGAAGGAHRDEEAELEIVWDVPTQPQDAGLFAWLAGEAGAITRLRRQLVGGLGLDRSRVAFMGYWRLGRPEN
jgi:NADPH-dependent ferric siderophore reductase